MDDPASPSDPVPSPDPQSPPEPGSPPGQWPNFPPLPLLGVGDLLERVAALEAHVKALEGG